VLDKAVPASEFAQANSVLDKAVPASEFAQANSVLAKTMPFFNYRLQGLSLPQYFAGRYCRLVREIAALLPGRGIFILSAYSVVKVQLQLRKSSR